MATVTATFGDDASILALQLLAVDAGGSTSPAPEPCTWSGDPSAIGDLAFPGGNTTLNHCVLNLNHKTGSAQITGIDAGSFRTDFVIVINPTAQVGGTGTVTQQS